MAVNKFVLYTILKQSIIIVQGVHFVFALFNLQGTPFTAANFYILAHNFPFVKMFFTNFQIYFCVFCCAPVALHRDSLAIVSQHNAFVKHYFSKFPTFFKTDLFRDFVQHISHIQHLHSALPISTAQDYAPQGLEIFTL